MGNDLSEPERASAQPPQRFAERFGASVDGVPPGRASSGNPPGRHVPTVGRARSASTIRPRVRAPRSPPAAGTSARRRCKSRAAACPVPGRWFSHTRSPGRTRAKSTLPRPKVSAVSAPAARRAYSRPPCSGASGWPASNTRPSPGLSGAAGASINTWSPRTRRTLPTNTPRFLPKRAWTSCWLSIPRSQPGVQPARETHLQFITIRLARTRGRWNVRTQPVQRPPGRRA